MLQRARCESYGWMRPWWLSAQSAPAPDQPRFFADIASDYRNFVSWENLQWLAIGSVATLVVAEADEAVRQRTEDPNAPITRALDAGETGATYGNLTLQVPLAWDGGPYRARPATSAASTRAATCCARRSARSVGPMPSSTRPIAPGPTVIRDRFHQNTHRRRSPRRWCCTNTTGGRWAF